MSAPPSAPPQAHAAEPEQHPPDPSSHARAHLQPSPSSDEDKKQQVRQTAPVASSTSASETAEERKEQQPSDAEAAEASSAPDEIASHADDAASTVDLLSKAEAQMMRQSNSQGVQQLGQTLQQQRERVQYGETPVSSMLTSSRGRQLHQTIFYAGLTPEEANRPILATEAGLTGKPAQSRTRAAKGRTPAGLVENGCGKLSGGASARALSGSSGMAAANTARQAARLDIDYEAAVSRGQAKGAAARSGKATPAKRKQTAKRPAAKQSDSSQLQLELLRVCILLLFVWLVCRSPLAHLIWIARDVVLLQACILGQRLGFGFGQLLHAK
jgi:hypothetical protein